MLNKKPRLAQRAESRFLSSFEIGAISWNIRYIISPLENSIKAAVVSGLSKKVSYNNS
ncbi:hypothetical protein ACH3O9_15830 [Leeuwenhoekiella sp. A16]|uniref:hypothetical protein n=1 Tax=Leeuwenhoekiella sp. A16 TaxID=3141462 RepID=UPI003A800CB7